MLQEDLTDEMVVLAKQLKQSSLLMSQSIQNTEKVSFGSFNCVILHTSKIGAEICQSYESQLQMNVICAK